MTTTDSTDPAAVGADRSAEIDPTFHDDIEGYCGRLSYTAGDTVELHVSTRADRFEIAVHRWGATREQVHTASAEGVYTPAPTDADSRGCGWPALMTFKVDPSWRSGFYLVTLTAVSAPDGRAVAHAGFVVRAAGERASALLVLATNTWNAYNTWGGASLYTGGKEVSFHRPFSRGLLDRPEVDRDDRKARPARWGETPDADGEEFQRYRIANGYAPAIGSTGWFTHERRFVEWAESEGYRFDFAVSSDLEDPATVAGYDTIVHVGHDEYWSAPQRRSVEGFVRSGGHLASLSGNTMFWQVRLTDDATAMVCHKYSAHETDPVVAAGEPERMTGMWCDPLVDDPEWSLLGAGSAFGLYHRFGNATARAAGGFTVYRHGHWLFDGTDLRYGDLLGARHGAVGYETVGCPIDLDEYQLPIARLRPGMPADIEVVAVAPASSLGVGDYPKSISALSDQGDLEFVAERLYGSTDEDALARVRYGNAVMLVCRPFGESGGEVVTVGTTDWVFGLDDDAAVQQVTHNILHRLIG